MYQVRIIVDHFVIGTTPFPKGATMQVNQVVRDYLVREKRAVDITDEGVSTPKEASGYNRRDMQAGETPPVVSSAPSVPKARRKKRGRPRKAKVNE